MRGLGSDRKGTTPKIRCPPPVRDYRAALAKVQCFRFFPQKNPKAKSGTQGYCPPLGNLETTSARPAVLPEALQLRSKPGFRGSLGRPRLPSYAGNLVSPLLPNPPFREKPCCVKCPNTVATRVRPKWRQASNQRLRGSFVCKS